LSVGESSDKARSSVIAGNRWTSTVGVDSSASGQPHERCPAASAATGKSSSSSSSPWAVVFINCRGGKIRLLAAVSMRRRRVDRFRQAANGLDQAAVRYLMLFGSGTSRTGKSRSPSVRVDVRSDDCGPTVGRVAARTSGLRVRPAGERDNGRRDHVRRTRASALFVAQRVTGNRAVADCGNATSEYAGGHKHAGGDHLGRQFCRTIHPNLRQMRSSSAADPFALLGVTAHRRHAGPPINEIAGSRRVGNEASCSRQSRQPSVTIDKNAAGVGQLAGIMLPLTRAARCGGLARRVRLPVRPIPATRYSASNRAGLLHNRVASHAAEPGRVRIERDGAGEIVFGQPA
jgi:hypothetical protein